MKRCSWVDLRSERYIAYHDHRWGKPEHDDRQLFEMLILESFQAGLSWLTILHERVALKACVGGFDPAVVAAYSRERVESLMANPGIVRNRRKILAASGNV